MVRATTEATEVEKGGHMLLENRNFTGKLKPRQVQGPNKSMGWLQKSCSAGVLQSKSQNQTGLQDFQSTSVVHPFSQNSPTRGFLKDEAMALPWKMASQRCGGAEDKHNGGNKGVREHRPSQDRKLIWKQEIKFSFLIMPHPPKRISPFLGKCFGEHQSHLCLSCVGSSLLSHLEALTRVLQFKAGVPIYSKFI